MNTKNVYANDKAMVKSSAHNFNCNINTPPRIIWQTLDHNFIFSLIILFSCAYRKNILINNNFELEAIKGCTVQS